MPPAASQLCSMLPPPSCFHGPFVVVDQVMELIKHCNVSETGKYLLKIILTTHCSSFAQDLHLFGFIFKGTILSSNTENAKLFEYPRSVHWVPKDNSTERAIKKRGLGEDSEEDESDKQPSGPPANDVYRKRQQKRVK